jgi:hypothetical protein
MNIERKEGGIMRVLRVLLPAGISTVMLLAPCATASSGVSGCTVVSDPRGDQDPGPLPAAGYDQRDLDLTGFDFRGDGRQLVVRTRSAHLSQPVAPPGYRLSFQTYFSTRSESGDRSFKLTSEFDGASSLFTLGATAAGDPAAPDGSGKAYTQIGGPLSGSVNYRTGEVTVRIPYQLISQFAPGRDAMTLYAPAVGSYWGFGNPSVSSGNNQVVGSSGYNRLADGAVANDPFRLSRTGRCTS